MLAIAIDTNIFVRVFVDDNARQHAQAVKLVETHGQVFIGTVVMVEAVWTLKKVFKLQKSNLVQFVNAVLEGDSFILEQREIIEAAMFAYADGNADFSDYVILESSRNKGVGRFYTFDKEISRTEGVVLLGR